MSRDTPSSGSRPLTVWTLVSVAVAGSWAGVHASVTSLASAPVWQGTFADLLAAVASAALVTSASWLWIATTVTVVALVRGREASGHGLTRRLVLVACGVAVVSSVSSPALAGGGGSSEQGLAGLPLPDRAVAGAPASPASPASPGEHPRHASDLGSAPPPGHGPPAASAEGELITVRAGDSLWSIAESELGADASLGEVDQRWRALYAANRSAIGTDPDLITPGQQLRPLRSRTDQ